MFPTNVHPSRKPTFKRCLSLATLVIFGPATVGNAADLVLWNRLGSASEILNSAVGPGLQFYGGGDELSVPATPAYVPGMFGGALSIGPGNYYSQARVHNVVFNNANLYLSAEQGTVEV